MKLTNLGWISKLTAPGRRRTNPKKKPGYLNPDKPKKKIKKSK
jgi:hypothetical protein